jgi:hypothetical protein
MAGYGKRCANDPLLPTITIRENLTGTLAAAVLIELTPRLRSLAAQRPGLLLS